MSHNEEYGMSLTVGSLFSGAGLGDLGLEWAGFEHKWFCEVDPYARKVLALRWPGVPVYEDARGLDGKTIESVDVLAGGFPCQPFSSAARGRNVASKDRRTELSRIAAEMRPRFVIGENVNRRPVESIAAELCELGYATHVFCFSSSEIGADHKRNRWWLCAHADHQGEFYLPVHAEMARVSKIRRGVRKWSDYARAVRVPNDDPHRVDRLTCTGNGQDPFASYLVGRLIQEHAAKTV
jgi:DNA (cytosine-5)-methyltransferase 1